MWSLLRTAVRSGSSKTCRIQDTQVVSAFESSVQYIFRYGGAFPDTKIHAQFKEQVRKEEQHHIKKT